MASAETDMAETDVIDGLTVRLKQFRPIPLDVSFDCPAGKLTVLVGPSGGGKSTILRSIAGIYAPLEGHVRSGGEDWYDTDKATNVPPQQRAVGYVFQDYALFPHMDAATNIAAALGHLNKMQQHDRARELLALVNLSGLEDRKPHQLSGGQQQRVALARAMARDPRVLLLDEPFSAVDQVTRRRLYQELVTLKGKFRIPMILVTHDLEEASKLADKMVIIHQGRSLQAGPPNMVMTRPESRLVARLVDLPNVLDGRIVEHNESRQLTIIEWAGTKLEAQLQTDFPPGTDVSFAIPAASVLLHSRVHRSRGVRENPITATIKDYLTLGDYTQVTAKVGNQDHTLLTFSVPAHVARRNNLAEGVEVGVSLLSAAIHIMPNTSR